MMAKTVGAAAAVMPARGTMTHHRDQAFELVEGVNEYDVDAFGISLAGRCILSYIRAGGQKRERSLSSPAPSPPSLASPTPTPGQYKSTP